MKGIYKITNPSGHVYIGQSSNIKKRMREHKSVKEGSFPISRSIIKHGFSNHRVEVIHELPVDATIQVINDYEQLYISLYRECGVIMLNANNGGSANCHTEENKAKMSAAKKGIPLSASHIQSLVDSHKGYIMPEEQKDKIAKSMSLHMKERVKDERYLKRITEACIVSSKKRKGVHLSEEHKRRVSEGLKASLRLKPRKPRVGYKHSDETKRKIGLANSKKR